MVLKSKWGRIQPEIQPSSDREQDVSRKPLEVSRNALRAEITYDTLVAHSAMADRISPIKPDGAGRLIVWNVKLRKPRMFNNEFSLDKV